MKKTILILSFASLCFSAFAAFEPNAEKYKDVPSAIKNAHWIWSHIKNAKNNSGSMWGEDIANSFALFRHVFEVKEVPAHAPLFISADQNYRLYINGEYVNAGPARGYQREMPYDEIDVAKYLKKGKNIIAIRAYNAGRGTFQYISQGWAGVIFSLDLGKEGFVSSGRGTLGMRQTSCSRDTAPHSFQMNNQEHIDMRIEPHAWQTLDFDDSQWAKINGRTYNCMPIDNFSPRGIPLFEVSLLSPKNLVVRGAGKSFSDSEKYRNLNELYDFEMASMKNFAVNESASKITFLPSKEGEVQSAIVDFGKMVVGMPILKIEGAKGGEIVDIILEEVYTPALNLRNNYNNNSSIPSISNRIICREGTNEHEFFQMSGFRYMLLRVRKNQNSELKITPQLRWSVCAMEERGAFKTSDESVNKIWDICRHTQRICTLDAYVDTPWREQAQWWGDARVQGKNTFFISGDSSILRRGIKIISMQKIPDGLTYGHAPTIAHGCVLPDFSLIWICTVWDYYWQTGKIDAYTEHRDTVLSILSYFDKFTDPSTGLVVYDPRYWLFLDWTGLQKNGSPGVLNMWLLYSLERMQSLCEAENMPSDAAMYAARAAKVRSAIEKNLLDKDGLLHDGLFPDGKLNPSTSIQMQTLAKMCKVEGFNFEKAKNEILLPYIRGGKNKIEPSSYWIVYVFDVLIDAGNARDVYDFIKRRWQKMADYGSAFESYGANCVGGNSHSHAWSAHPVYILPQILGGVKQEAAAWKKISFRPNLFESSAKIIYPTPQGQIEVEWKDGSPAKLSKPDSIELTTEIPAEK